MLIVLILSLIAAFTVWGLAEIFYEGFMAPSTPMDDALGAGTPDPADVLPERSS